MNDQDLVNALREHAEWARANEWETPITLGDDLAELMCLDILGCSAKDIEIITPEQYVAEFGGNEDG